MSTPTQRRQRLRYFRLLPTGLTLLIAFALLMVHQYVVGRQQLFEQMETEAAIISANSAAALAFGDRKAAQETVDAMLLSPQITYGALYRKDGTMFAMAHADRSRLPSSPSLENEENGQNLIDVPKVATSNLLNAVFRHEVNIAGTSLGTLVFHVSLSSLYRRLLEYALGVLGIGTVAVMLAYRLTGKLRGRMARAEEQLQQMALYDQLTGLPNRSLFERELNQAMARVARENGGVALLFLDVDDFKKVNDSLGHTAGDKVLSVITERIRAVVRSGDVVGRLGGDEFGVILYGLKKPEDAARLVHSMIEVVARPIPVESTTCHVGLSVGILMLAGNTGDPAILLRHADMAMYEAKTHGKNGFRFFSEEIDARVNAELRLESGLRDALHDGGKGMWVAYQPQLCAQTRHLVGVEALLRWQQADGRQVSPGEFIPVAEQSDLITLLGAWVLNRVCQDLAGMRLAGIELPMVSVNVSPHQLLRDHHIVKNFCKTLARFDEPVERFRLEVTESTLMEDGGSAVLDALHAAGFSLSIDDFGTGYSSLGYLKRFQVGELKIDQSFVRNLPMSTEDAAIVMAAVQMAHALQIKVVAEGVETVDQAEFLSSCGCDILQGFLLGHPMAPLDLVAYMRERWPDV